MENKGLLFIPDISGFTRFVTETEINHSRLIIQELLELLINANQTGLELSEVEGDAILFYKFGEMPELEELYSQVEKMFSSFHHHLQAYDSLRLCQCKACVSAINLTLKVITHYGEFTQYNVKNFTKLLGKDVIVAHQLLKNDIDQHEYWLVTKSLLQSDKPREFAKWMKWNSSGKQTEAGEIQFHYVQLGQLKNELPPLSPVQLEPARKAKMLTVSKEYDAHIITMFHGAGGFNYRHLWQEGVKKVEEFTHFLPRVGMKSRRTLESGEVIVCVSSYSFHPDRIEFSETDEKKETSTYFILEKITDHKTRLTMNLYIRKNVAGEFVFRLFKKKEVKKSMEKSLINLGRIVQDIHVATEY